MATALCPAHNLTVRVPKGASRFHFAGGARFVHGSAMPQEVVVPVITVGVSEAVDAVFKALGVE